MFKRRPLPSLKITSLWLSRGGGLPTLWRGAARTLARFSAGVEATEHAVLGLKGEVDVINRCSDPTR